MKNILVIAAFLAALVIPSHAQPGPVFQTTNSAYVGATCASNVAYLYGPTGRLLTCQSGVLVDVGSAGGAVTSIATGSCLTGGPITTTGTISIGTTINPQTSTYQVLAADFSLCKTITVASGTFTITLVASGSQPANGTRINIVNYGTGVVTVARSGQNINGGTASLTLGAGSASAPTSTVIWSDGVDYFANGIAITGTGSMVRSDAPTLTGIITFGAGNGTLSAGGNATFNGTSGTGFQINSAHNGVSLGATGPLSWGATPNGSQTAGLSLISSGLIGVGTGAQNSFAGNLKLTPATTTAGDVPACLPTGGAGLMSFAAATCGTSLRSAKNNIRPLGHGLDYLMRLTPSRFKWNFNGAEDIGFIADDVAAIDSLLGAYDKGKLQNFKDRAVLTVAVSAIQQQQAEIRYLGIALALTIVGLLLSVMRAR